MILIINNDNNSNIDHSNSDNNNNTPGRQEGWPDEPATSKCTRKV